MGSNAVLLQVSMSDGSLIKVVAVYGNEGFLVQDQQTGFSSAMRQVPGHVGVQVLSNASWGDRIRYRVIHI